MVANFQKHFATTSSEEKPDTEDIEPRVHPTADLRLLRKSTLPGLNQIAASSVVSPLGCYLFGSPPLLQRRELRLLGGTYDARQKLVAMQRERFEDTDIMRKFLLSHKREINIKYVTNQTWLTNDRRTW